VIGTKIGGIPEQVEDGKTGFLFEMGNVEQLADKMSVLSMDMEMRVGMGKAARHKVEIHHFYWSGAAMYCTYST